jgi:hypothetical protein
VVLNFFMLSYELVSSEDLGRSIFFISALGALYTTVATLGASLKVALPLGTTILAPDTLFVGKHVACTNHKHVLLRATLY